MTSPMNPGRHAMRVAACALVVSSAQLGAQQPRLTMSPARPLPGSLVTLTLSGLGDRGDSIVAIAGTMAGEPLHFVARGGQGEQHRMQLRAVRAIDLHDGARDR